MNVKMLVFVAAASAVAAVPAMATTFFTSSSAFDAATSGDTFTKEQYSSGTAGELINGGTVFDGLTYSFTARPSGTLLGGIITNKFNSFSGLSLGGNQSGGDQFFFGGDSFTVTFPKAIKAVGVFFNVNANSGNYDVNSSVGTASTGSTSYDTKTFVFDGIVSTTPFTSITVTSDNASLGSFNIPEIEFSAAVPEPATWAMLLFGFLGIGAMMRAAHRRGEQVA